VARASKSGSAAGSSADSRTAAPPSSVKRARVAAAAKTTATATRSTRSQPAAKAGKNTVAGATTKTAGATRSTRAAARKSAGGEPEQKRTRSAATRQEIINATIECFVQIGYVRTTTTEIAKLAGYTRGAVQHYRNLKTLHEKMKEASVRKAQKDPDVAPFLPDTIHKEPIKIVLDRGASKLYHRIANDLVDDLDEAQNLFGSSFNVLSHYGMDSKRSGPEDEIRGRIMSKIGCLKMLCSHPDLLRKSAYKYNAVEKEILWEDKKDGIVSSLSKMTPTFGSKGGSAYAAQLLEEGELTNLNAAPKLDFLVSYVKEFLEQDDANKVVIFATYVNMLDKISESLGKDICKIYSGKLDAKTKEDNKIAFNTDPNIRVLVSSDAGGYGVDLPAANLLINYDLPWSSGSAIQRNGRIQRASSTWPSIVIQDLLVEGSIEDRQYEMLQQKNAVATAVIDGQGIDEEGGIPMTVGSLKQFLTYASV